MSITFYKLFSRATYISYDRINKLLNSVEFFKLYYYETKEKRKIISL